MARLVSWLFVPGASDRFMTKLSSVRPGVAVLDLEDGQAVAGLAEARQRVAGVLRSGVAATGPALAVRSNPVGSAEFAADLAALGGNLSFLLLPKVSEADEVLEAASALEGMGLDRTALIPMLESAKGVRNTYQILTAHPLVRGVALGAEDLAADLGLPRFTANEPNLVAGRSAVLSVARAELILAAAAAGVELRIDSPHLSIAAEDSVEAAAVLARSSGFTAMFAVHPSQVQPVIRGFRPSDNEREQAQRLLDAADGGGARALDGTMVDEAVLRQARRVLDES